MPSLAQKDLKNYYEKVQSRGRKDEQEHLKLKDANLICRQQVFTRRIVHPWNEIPVKIRKFSRSGFKRTLKQKENVKYLRNRRMTKKDFEK